MNKFNIQNVAKAMSQEEHTILANIKSLAEELMSGGSASDAQDLDKMGLGGGAGMQQGYGAQKSDDMKAKEDEKAEKTKNENIDDMEDTGEKVKLAKDIVTTPSDTATATDDAEARMEDVLSTLTEENVEVVAKAIEKFRQKRNVAKSASPVMAVLSELTKVVKDIGKRQIEQETAFGNLLEGLGVTKQIELAMGSDRVEKSGAPIFADDNQRLAKELSNLMSVMKGQPTEQIKHAGTNSNIVRKNLDTAIFSLLKK